MPEMSGGEAAVRTVITHGVDIFFGIPGVQSAPVHDALYHQRGLSHILARHEQSVGFMADGYARASGRVGVCTVTSGPAVANIGAALAGATTDTSPVLAIASNIPSAMIGKGRGDLHDCGDQLRMIREVCRYYKRCSSVEEVSPAISELFEKLQYHRPGAAFLDVPTDILFAKKDVEITRRTANERLRVPEERARQAADLLSKAKRPIIWAGTGSVTSNAAEEVREMAERMGAPIFTTILSKGIVPSDHYLCMGNSGPQEWFPPACRTELHQYLAQSDLVLAIGTMFKNEDTWRWSMPFPDRLIHIDIDENEFNRNYPTSLPLHGDAKTVVKQILGSLKSSSVEPGWSEKGKRAREKILQERWKRNPQEMRALQVLRDAAPRNAIIVCDRCALSYWACLHLDMYETRSFLYHLGYAALGFGLPAAIGAKIARPDRPVILVVGDGGFQFTMPELATAVQFHVPIIILLTNDKGYASIRTFQDRVLGGRRYASDLQNPDFVQLAKSYGIDGSRIDTLDSMESVLKERIRSDTLSLIELDLELRVP